MNNLINTLKETFKNTYDVKFREIKTVIGDVTIVFIDTLSSTQFISDFIIKPMEHMSADIKNLQDVSDKVLNINDVSKLYELQEIYTKVLAGDVVIIAHNESTMLVCDVKSYNKRGIGIPDTEQVIKGPREGFTDAFVDNVTLIRRRVRNENLKTEVIRAGVKSHTTVVLMYLKGIAPEKLVERIKDAINSIESPFILDTNYIEEKLKSKSTTFDTIGYTEKPDIASARIMEGRVCVLVDGTPFVITAPHFFMESFQMADDYYLNKYFSNFNRVIRWLSFLMAIFLPGFYLAITTYHFSLIPSLFIFRMAVNRAGVPFPAVVEILMMMFLFQLVKEAGLRMPQAVGSAMSIVAGLILGDAAVGAGIASRITLVIVSISMVSYFLIPKLYTATSTWSIVIVLFSAFLGLPGFYIGSVLLIVHIASLDSCGYNFVFPVGTLRKFKYKDVLFRGDLKNISYCIFEREDDDEV